MTKPITDKAEVVLNTQTNSLLVHLNAHRDLRRISIRLASR